MDPLLKSPPAITLRVQMSTLSEQVLTRLREEITRQDMSQRDLAGLLGWSQSRVAHILNKRVELTVNDMEDFCSVLRIRPTEAVRDRGLEWCADLTPTEHKALLNLQQASEKLRSHILGILEVKVAEARRATPRKPILGKPRLK